MKESGENSNVNAIEGEKYTFCIMDLQVCTKRQVKARKKWKREEIEEVESTRLETK